MKPIFSAKNLSVGYDKKAVVSGINFNASKGSIICLLGPNGAGKSTILKTFSGLLAPIDGTVEIYGENIKAMSNKKLAKKMSVVLTENISPSLMTVYELTVMGRMPHTGFMGNLNDNDYKIAYDSLKAVGAIDLKDRYISELSDGEKQKVMIARAIAQEPEIIILDEPTSHLDIKYKIEIMRVLQKLTREKSITCILSLHDIDLAIKCCQTIILVNDNHIDAIGTPEEIVSTGLIQKLYDISGAIYNEITGSIEFISSNSNDIFVIGGGGSGTPIYRIFSRIGYGLTSGVIHKNDIDFFIAKSICSNIVSERPYEPIQDNTFSNALNMMQNSKCIIDSGFEIGYINKRNIELIEIALKQGKTVFSLRNKQEFLRFISMNNIDINIGSIYFCESIGCLSAAVSKVVGKPCI